MCVCVSVCECGGGVLSLTSKQSSTRGRQGYRSGQRVSAPLKNLISSRAGQQYLLSPALIRQAQWTPSSHDDQGSGTVKLLSDTAHFTSAKFQTEAMMIWGCITVQPSSPRPSVDHFTPFKHNPTIAFSLSLLVEKRVVCTLGREKEKKKVRKIMSSTY